MDPVLGRTSAVRLLKNLQWVCNVASRSVSTHRSFTTSPPVRREDYGKLNSSSHGWNSGERNKNEEHSSSSFSSNDKRSKNPYNSSKTQYLGNRRSKDANTDSLIDTPVLHYGKALHRSDVKEQELTATRIREARALLNPTSRHSANIDRAWIDTLGEDRTQEDGDRVDEIYGDPLIDEELEENAQGEQTSLGGNDDVSELAQELAMKANIRRAAQGKSTKRSAPLAQHAFLQSASSIAYPEPLEMRSKITFKKDFLEFKDDGIYNKSQLLKPSSAPWKEKSITLWGVDKYGKPIKGDGEEVTKSELGGADETTVPITDTTFHISKETRVEHIKVPHRGFLISLLEDTSKRDVLLFFEDEYVYVIRDPVPKSEHQFIVIPKKYFNFHRLSRESIPTIRHMDKVAKTIQHMVRQQHPESAPLRWGFMAVPAFDGLHMHIASSDFNSEFIRSQAKSGLVHFNSLANPEFLKSPQWMIHCLQVMGQLAINEKYVLTQLMKNPVCPICAVGGHELPWMLDHIQKKHIIPKDFHPIYGYVEKMKKA